MAHPYSRHGENAVGRRRARFLTTGKQYANGGRAHGDEAEDKKLIKRMMAEHEGMEDEMEPEGEKTGGRLDKRARGGKMQTVMHEFKTGKLHSGSKSGPKVGNRKQAIAIGLSEARKAGENVGPPKRASGGPVRKITPSKRKPHMSVNIVNITGSRSPRRRKLPKLPTPPLGLVGGAASPVPAPPALTGGPPLAPPMKRGGGIQKRQLGGGMGQPMIQSRVVTPLPTTPLPTASAAGAIPGQARFKDGGKIGRMRRGKDYGQGSGEGRLEEFKHMRGK